MMNILFNCNEYPPFKTGGIGNVTKIVAEGLVKKGHNIVVAGYYQEQQKSEAYSLQNGVHVYRYSLGYRDNWLKSRFQDLLQILGLNGLIIQKELDYYENKLLSLIKEYRIDILELTDYYNFNYCKSHLTFQKFDIPVVMRFHGSVYYLNANSGKCDRAVKRNDLSHFARAEYYSYVSRYVGEFVRQMGGDYAPKKEIVIHNMVEDQFFNDYQATTDNRTILFVGKLVCTKGAFSTVKAFNIFHMSHPDWKLKMVGPAYSDQLLKDINDSARADIIIEDYCDRNTVMKYIDDCSFVCIPSYFETFGMVPLEVMARRKAVIFTLRTSGPEIIQDGVDGILVEPDNIGMIVEKMSLMADKKDFRDEIALNGYNKIKNNFCASRVLESLEEFYQHLL